MELYDFPYIGNNHPNWLSYFSEGWLNHQPVIVSVFVGLVETCRKPSFFPLTAAINCGFCPLMFTVSRQMFYLHPENVIVCRILSGRLSHGLEKRSRFDDCPAPGGFPSPTVFPKATKTVSSLTSSRFDRIEKGISYKYYIYINIILYYWM